MTKRADFKVLNSDIVLTLRGQRDQRPEVDPLLAGGLRSWLEDDLSETTSTLSPEAPLILTPRSVVSDSIMAVPPLIALARGALVAALATQRVALGEVRHPMDDALSALEADPFDHELVDAIHCLDQDSFAQLAAEIDAHDTVLNRHLSTVPTSWLPRSNVRLTVPLGGARIVLSARANVALGTPTRSVASICFLDITTATLDEHTLRRLGVLGLIETLRSGAPPLRVASLSTATGDVEMLEICDDVLVDAVSDVVDAAKKRKVLS